MILPKGQCSLIGCRARAALLGEAPFSDHMIYPVGRGRVAESPDNLAHRGITGGATNYRWRRSAAARFRNVHEERDGTPSESDAALFWRSYFLLFLLFFFFVVVALLHGLH